MDQGCFRLWSTSFVLICWFVVGCSTIPENVTLVVKSTPSGVNVMSSEGWQCSTPCTRSVPRDSHFDLKLEQAGYQSVEQTVEIPELEPSRMGTYIGVGVGVVSGFVAIDLTEALGSFFFDALFGGKLGQFELSTSEKIEVVGLGVVTWGGIGYVIDRLLDGNRAKRPHHVDVSMVKRAEAVANRQTKIDEVKTQAPNRTGLNDL